MPYKQTFFEFLQRHAEVLGMALLTIIAVIGRAFYTGAKWREVIGDAILCPLVTFVSIPLMPESILGVTITPALLAVVVGVAGIHGVRYAAVIFAKRKGIDINKIKEQGNG